MVTGNAGSGKTSLAHQLASMLNITSNKELEAAINKFKRKNLPTN